MVEGGKSSAQFSGRHAFVRWPREAVQRSEEALYADSLSINISSRGYPSAP